MGSSPRKRWTRPKARAAGAALAVAAALVAAGPAGALPPPSEPDVPRRAATPTPSPSPPGDPSLLPFGSPVTLVLDDPISSATSVAGSVVRFHLAAPLVVGATTVAPAGARGTIQIVRTTKAGAGDVDGTVAIHLDPLALPGRNVALPLHATEYLYVKRSAGELTTRAAGDQALNVFVPYGIFYQVLRRGRQYVLPVGTTIRAETAAALRLGRAGAASIETPPPFVREFDVPHADLTAAPIYTPALRTPPPHPRGRATVAPRLTPKPEPSGSPAGAGSSPIPAVTTTAVPATGSPASTVPGGSASPSR